VFAATDFYTSGPQPPRFAAPPEDSLIMSSKVPVMPSAAFWRTFVAEYWNHRPAVFQGMVGAPLISEDELRMVLVAAGADTSIGARSVWIDRRKLTPAETAAAPITDADPSVAAYLDRLGGGREVFAVQYSLHPHSADLWLRARDFVQGLFHEIGMPPTCDTDLCFGKYSATPRGPHRDDHNNFAFVLSGTKRFLLWPDGYFEARGVPVLSVGGTSVGVAPGTTNWPRELGTWGSIEPFLDDAIVLEGRPGDVFFWPHSYWHMALCDPRETTLVLGISLFSRTRTDFLSELVGTIAKQLVPGDPAERILSWPMPADASQPPAAIDDAIADLEGLRHVLDRGALRDILTERWRGHASGYGLGRIPPRASSDLPAEVARVRSDARYPTTWQPHGGGLRAWANGTVIDLADARLAGPLLDQLRSGAWTPIDLTRDPELRPLIERLHQARTLEWA
jgi:50S ribosomal protein L16 3-hydroxylase